MKWLASLLPTLLLAGPVPQHVPFVQDQPCPTVAVHRTNPLAAPENTVAGINTVPATGSRWVEVDIQDSVSGYSVLMHDKTVDRTTPGTGAVNTLSLGYLTGLSATDYMPWTVTNSRTRTAAFTGSTNVPYAWDYLNAIRANGLVGILDVQNVQTEFAAKKLLEYMDRWPGLRASFWYMGSADEINAMRPYAGSTLKYTFIEYPAAGTMKTAEYLRSLGATAYALPMKEVTPEKVAYYRAAGIQFWTWSSDPGYDTPAFWQKAYDTGVDVLVTNYPSEALALCPTLP